MAGRKFLALPYYSHRAVFASPLSAFFHLQRFLRQSYVNTHGKNTKHLPYELLTSIVFYKEPKTLHEKLHSQNGYISKFYGYLTNWLYWLG